MLVSLQPKLKSPMLIISTFIEFFVRIVSALQYPHSFQQDGRQEDGQLEGPQWLNLQGPRVFGIHSNPSLINSLQDGEDIKGKITIELSRGKQLDHQGIKVELIGAVENLVDKTQTTHFIQLAQELEAPGTLTDTASFNFSFNRVEKQFETYNGIIVRLR